MSYRNTLHVVLIVTLSSGLSHASAADRRAAQGPAADSAAAQRAAVLRAASAPDPVAALAYTRASPSVQALTASREKERQMEAARRAADQAKRDAEWRARANARK